MGLSLAAHITVLGNLFLHLVVLCPRFVQWFLGRPAWYWRRRCHSASTVFFVHAYRSIPPGTGAVGGYCNLAVLYCLHFCFSSIHPNKSSKSQMGHSLQAVTQFAHWQFFCRIHRAQFAARNFALDVWPIHWLGRPHYVDQLEATAKSNATRERG